MDELLPQERIEAQVEQLNAIIDELVDEDVEFLVMMRWDNISGGNEKIMLRFGGDKWRLYSMCSAIADELYDAIRNTFAVTRLQDGDIDEDAFPRD